MALAYRFVSFADLGLTSPRQHQPFSSVKSPCQNPSFIISNNNNNNNNNNKLLLLSEPPRSFKSSVELDRSLTTMSDEDEMGEGFFKAIEELERMTREPSDILEEMNDRLSARELQLVLVYFSQEGRDSWCALEVFEWLKKENRVDKETLELMLSLMCGWVKKIIQGGEHDVGDVVNLLVEMDCVGLKPSFSMIQKVISLYWDMGDKHNALQFVKQVLRCKIITAAYYYYNSDDKKGGPAGYLAWKMMVDGKYMDAIRLVIELKECGLNPQVYSYLIGMTAVVKELNELSKALRKLKGFKKAGLIAELDMENVKLIEKYQSDLIKDGVCLSKWAIEEGGGGVVHERLLAMYICAGRGLEAENQLWEMKLMGKEADRDLYDIVLAICASRREKRCISRLLTNHPLPLKCNKKTFSWLLRGYVKGGYFDDAAQTIINMLDMGLFPDYLDRAAVMQGLRNQIQHSGDVALYLKLCKRLSDADLIGTCLVYMYINKYKLWIINMV